MKGTFRRGHQKRQRTYVKKPADTPPTAVEYGPFDTPEEAEACRKAMLESMAKLGLKGTVTTITVHDSASQTAGDQS